MRMLGESRVLLNEMRMLGKSCFTFFVSGVNQGNWEGEGGGGESRNSHRRCSKKTS